MFNALYRVQSLAVVPLWCRAATCSPAWESCPTASFGVPATAISFIPAQLKERNWLSTVFVFICFIFWPEKNYFFMSVLCRFLSMSVRSRKSCGATACNRSMHHTSTEASCCVRNGLVHPGPRPKLAPPLVMGISKVTVISSLSFVLGCKSMVAKIS